MQWIIGNYELFCKALDSFDELAIEFYFDLDHFSLVGTAFGDLSCLKCFLMFLFESVALSYGMDQIFLKIFSNVMAVLSYEFDEGKRKMIQVIPSF